MEDGVSSVLGVVILVDGVAGAMVYSWIASVAQIDWEFPFPKGLSEMAGLCQ